MVKIVNYQRKTSEVGKTFYALELQGGIEMVRSKETNRLYMTARKTTIPTTFEMHICEMLIGTELPGSIVKVICEPYEYVIKETGEVIVLDYRYEYVEDGQEPQRKSIPVPTTGNDLSEKTLEDVFDENGELVH